MHHNLKTLPCYFSAISSGRKTFEIRYNDDRGFQCHDTIEFQEYDPKRKKTPFTGKFLFAEITYVSSYEQKPCFVVFSFRILKKNPMTLKGPK
jgi:ASC-1-like (ASCH) protein